MQQSQRQVVRILIGSAVVAVAAISAGIASIISNTALGIVAIILGAGALAVSLVALVESRSHKPQEQTVTANIDGSSQESADSVALRHLELLTRGGPRPLVDPDTSLPDDRYFELALEGRVAAARRHLWPVTLVMLRLTLDPTAANDPAVRKDAFARFSLLLQGTMRESDVLCRLDADTFALMLDDTAEEGGVWSAERVQAEASKQHPAITKLVAGISSYPSHGLDAPKVLEAARYALARATQNDAGRGLGIVEVARAEH
jgi:GGDEF domain-containing protein